MLLLLFLVQRRDVEVCLTHRLTRGVRVCVGGVMGKIPT